MRSLLRVLQQSYNKVSVYGVESFGIVMFVVRACVCVFGSGQWLAVALFSRRGVRLGGVFYQKPLLQTHFAKHSPKRWI